MGIMWGGSLLWDYLKRLEREAAQTEIDEFPSFSYAFEALPLKTFVDAGYETWEIEETLEAAEEDELGDPRPHNQR